MNQTQNAVRNQPIQSGRQAGQRLAIVAAAEETPEEIPFADNYEYLAALEKEALLMLVLSAVRSGRTAGLENDGAGCLLCAGLGLTPQNITREHIEAELTRLRNVNRSRQNKTLRSGIKLFFPLFCRENKLDDFDEKILLLLFMHATSETFRNAFCPCGLEDDQRGIIIRVVLFILCMDYGDQLKKRRHFSRGTPLVAREIIFFKSNYENRSSHVMDEIITINERHVRYIIGNNRLYNSTYNEISIEQSAIDLKTVVMPEHVKKPLVDNIARYLRREERSECLQLDEFLEYGTALALFFHGPSGTGKTMMARALAHHFGRPLITVNLSNTQYSWESESVMIQAFREAALLQGFIFFDEADGIFKEGSYLARSLLIQIEKAKCVVIFATNKAASIDPAMERRLSMKINFPLPDAEQRLKIWKALLPVFIRLAPDVNMKAFNDRYSFSGGLIKNTIFLAVNAADPDDRGNIVITGQMLEQAADLQTKQMAQDNKLCKLYRPERKTADLPLTEKQRTELKNIARAFQYAQKMQSGLNLLISGASIETGISAAEALAAECGVKVKSFKYSDMDVTGNDNELIDKVSQDKVKLIDFAFIRTTEEAHLLIIIDDNGVINWDDAGKTEDNKNDSLTDKSITKLLSNIRDYKGICCFITHKKHSPNIPSVFHAHVKLEYPTEEMQMRQWEKHLAPGAFSDDDLVELVQQNPMHITEIDGIIHRTTIQALIEGKKLQPALENVQAVIEKYRGKNETPVLFGRK